MANQRSVLILSFGLLLLAARCGDTSRGAVKGAAAREIVVGEYGSLTGPQATFGQSSHNAIVLAVDEINRKGGINGTRLRVVSEDDQSKPEEATNAVTKLISHDNVVAVLGEVASSASLAAAPICQSSGVPMITPASTNPEVTKKGDYIFRVCFTDDYQGRALADYAHTLGYSRVALLTDVKSDYSRGLAQEFERRFTRRGGQIIARSSYANGDSDFRSQLTAIRAATPQAVFVPGYYTDVAQIAVQGKDLGLNVPLFGGDGWESPKLPDIGGAALTGSFYSNHYFNGDPAPEVARFVGEYKRRYGTSPDAFAAPSYDATYVLADALRRKAGEGGKRLRDALAATRGFSAVTGNITFGSDRNASNKKLVLEEVRNGALVYKGSAGVIQ
jgi:branched-chain amino acid transport system substrate-binding protein